VCYTVARARTDTHTAMPGMYKSVLGGKPTFVPRQKTMADGIAIENVGDVPFALIKDYVDEIVLVNEDEVNASNERVFDVCVIFVFDALM
jgi:threonine dehydratase